MLTALRGQFDQKSWRVVAVTHDPEEAFDLAYDDMREDLADTEEQNWPWFTEVADYVVRAMRVGDVYEHTAQYAFAPSAEFDLVWSKQGRLALRAKDRAWVRARFASRG